MAIPLFCPVCDMLMSSSDDALMFERYECCEACGMRWAEPNADRWLKEGWRPSSSELMHETERRRGYPISVSF